MGNKVIRNIIVPCNKTLYDVDGAFADLKEIDWRQNINVEVGAKAYIYVGKPFETGLVYECKVIKTNKIIETIDDSKYTKTQDGLSAHYGKYMTLKMVKKLNHEYLSYSNLRKHGINTCMQRQCYVPNELQKYIDLE